MWSVPPSATVPPWAVSLWAEGQLIPLTQVPPLAWAAFPSSHPPVLTNPKCSRLAGPCRPHSLPQHSLPQHSLPQHSLQPIPSLQLASRCVGRGVASPRLSSNSDSWHPLLLHTLSSLLWHSTQLPHSQPYAHPRPQRNSVHIPPGWGSAENCDNL